MNFDEIKLKFGDRIQKDSGGDSVKALCPGHDDHNPSLTISKSEDGNTLVYCHAHQCEPERILAPVGLKVSDLFLNGRGPKQAKKPKRYDPVVARYDYHDKSGSISLRVEKRQSKTFAQCRPDPENPGKFIYNRQGVDYILYRLPELLAASPDTWVMLCEGEKDVDNLRNAGYIATTNAGGAGKWLGGYTQTLKGRRVCILPDNDEPGRNHALTVGSQLVEHAADVRVLELPDLPLKGDVSDWLNAGNNPATLADLVEAAPTWASWAEEEHKKAAAKQASPALAQASSDDGKPTWKTYSDAVDKLGYDVRMNDLDDTVEVNGNKFNDGMEAEVLMKMHDLGFKKAEWVRRSITATAHTRRHHPIKDFLSGLQWDDKDRIAELERYVRDKHPRIVYADGSVMPVFGAWLKRFGIGAVAKVLQDGRLRAQNPMLVLSGGQGVGKSTLARFLNPLGDEFFIESFIDPDANDHHRYLATKFLWEVAELGATARKADREGLKAFLTKADVTFRAPYAHHPVTKPAMCSFIGTINPEIGFLSDPTGHRRFLPVEIDSIDFAYLNKVDCHQLWAQFVALHRAGESAALTPEEQDMADAIRGDHEIEDPFAGFILKYYEVNPDQTGWTVAAHEVVDQLVINGVHNANVTNIGSSLKRLGLTSKRVGKSKVTTWYGIRRNDYGDMVRR